MSSAPVPASPAPASHPPSAAAPRRRSRRRVWLVLVALAVVGGGAWRYRVTRPEYRYARGAAAVLAGDFHAAREYAARLDGAGAPDHANLLLGETALAAGWPDQGLAHLNRVRPDGPLRVRAAAASGRCLVSLGEVREAYRVFRFVVDEQPDHVEAYRGLAVIAYDLGQLTEAVDYLRRIAELDPADPRPHRLMGLIYKDMAQLPPAEEAYREALRRGPTAVVALEVRAELAEVLERQGRFADGLSVLDGEPPVGAAAAESRAQCLRGLGRQSEAAGVLDAALARRPNVALFRLRGQVYQEQNQPAEALRCFERAVDSDPADHQARYLLGQAYAAAGRKEEAARTLARVDELKADLDLVTALTREAMAKPWDPAVRLRLAGLCDRMGRPELAEMWRRAAVSCSAGPR